MNMAYNGQKTPKTISKCVITDFMDVAQFSLLSATQKLCPVAHLLIVFHQHHFVAFVAMRSPINVCVFTCIRFIFLFFFVNIGRPIGIRSCSSHIL